MRRCAVRRVCMRALECVVEFRQHDVRAQPEVIQLLLVVAVAVGVVLVLLFFLSFCRSCCCGLLCFSACGLLALLMARALRLPLACALALSLVVPACLLVGLSAYLLFPNSSFSAPTFPVPAPPKRPQVLCPPNATTMVL